MKAVSTGCLTRDVTLALKRPRFPGLERTAIVRAERVLDIAAVNRKSGTRFSATVE
jgi:hypothetical protein